MIYSLATLRKKAFHANIEISIDDEYMCICAIKDAAFTDKAVTLPIHYNIFSVWNKHLSYKVKDVLLRQKFGKNRNTRNNLLLLCIDRFNIWKIGHYQKNKIIIAELIDKSASNIGLIPEEMITREMIQSCAYLCIPSIKYFPEHMITPELQSELDRYNVLFRDPGLFD